MSSRKRVYNNQSENGNNSGGNSTPFAKRTRSCVLDLTLLIGEENYEYPCNAGYMSTQSTFIDEKLVPLLRGGHKLIISLTDITPWMWGVMMDILQSPNEVGDVQMNTLISAAEKFHQYGFDTGIAQCDVHISNQYKKYYRIFLSHPELTAKSMDDLIEWALTVTKLRQLTGSKLAIFAYFSQALVLPQDEASYYGGLIFTEAQLKKLAPIIAKGNLLGDQFTDEEIMCPLFPKYFLDSLLQEYEDRRLKNPCHSIRFVRLQLTTTSGKHKVATLMKFTGKQVVPASFAGEPEQVDSVVWENWLLSKTLVLRKIHNGDWVIAVAERQHEAVDDGYTGVLWRAYMTSNLVNVPPSHRWEKVDERAPNGIIKVTPILPPPASV